MRMIKMAINEGNFKHSLGRCYFMSFTVKMPFSDLPLSFQFFGLSLTFSLSLYFSLVLLSLSFVYWMTILLQIYFSMILKPKGYAANYISLPHWILSYFNRYVQNEYSMCCLNIILWIPYMFSWWFLLLTTYPKLMNMRLIHID